jgi:hypothetical protein
MKWLISEKGSDIMRYLPNVAKAFTETMMKGFSQEEQRDLMAKLQQIIVNLSAVEPDPRVGADLLPKFS